MFWISSPPSYQSSQYVRSGFCHDSSKFRTSNSRGCKTIVTYAIFYVLSSQSDWNYRSATSSDSENTPLIPHSDHKNTEGFSYSSAFVVFLLVFSMIVPLSGLCGAWIHGSISKDILDPRVRDRIRHEWNIELGNHKQAIERAQEEEHELQEKKHRREREEAERIEKEKRERARMRLYWDGIHGDEHCIAHRTRKYTARLANLLPGIDAIGACKATPLTIHEVTYDSPLHCEDRSVGNPPFPSNTSV